MERLDLICTSAGTTLAQVRGYGQTRLLIETRKHAARVLRIEYGLSYPMIGRMLNRDHTTVLTMVRGDRRKRRRYPAGRDWMILEAA